MLDTPDGRVACYAAGAGPTVVLLHSMNAAASSMEMSTLFTALAAGHRVVAIDWLGFGASERPDVAYRPATYLRVLDTVLDSLDGPPPAIVALSLPCQYVAILGSRRPDRFDRLVLISATGVGRFPGAHRRMGLRRAAEVILRMPLVGSTLFRLLTRRRTIDRFLNGTVVDPAMLPERYRAYAVASAHQSGAERAPLAFICGLLDAPEAASAYTRLQVPTLLLYGDHPRFSDPDAMEVLAEGRPALQFRRVTDSGDLPAWERPADHRGAHRAVPGRTCPAVAWPLTSLGLDDPIARGEHHRPLSPRASRLGPRAAPGLRGSAAA